MNFIPQLAKLIPLFFLIVSYGCFPNWNVSLLEKDKITTETRIVSPTKAFLADASVILLPNGFTVRNDTIFGTGQRFWLDVTGPHDRGHAIPLDSVAAMTYYEGEISVGRGIASFLLVLSGGAMTPLSLYCLSCPKCCFGSCPTVYTYDGNDYDLVTELFSNSISKLLEENDLDLLTQDVNVDRRYVLRVTNEALETHYINKMSLLALMHPEGIQVFPTDDGGFVSIDNLVSTTKVVSRQGKNVASLVQNPDNQWYRTETSVANNLGKGGKSDWIDLKINVPKKSRKVMMVIRMRNTLLSTILFYDVVLASQGIEALEWTERMNTDRIYARQFHAIYKAFSGVKVKVLRNGEWVEQGSITDVGPIAWKYVASDIPVSEKGELSVRLEFFPDNFMIDYVGFDVDVSSTANLTLQEIFPTEIRDNAGTVRMDILELIKKDDEKYLITNPGESYHFFYDMPAEENNQLSLFLSSKGYYTEWIRGSWIRTRKYGYRFNLFAIDETLAQLAKSWSENKDLIEEEFFKTRIPVVEK